MVALAVLTAACSNEDDSILSGLENSYSDDVKMITETITATNGDGATRAAVAADASFTWTAGDQIAVHVSDGNYYTTTALAAGDYTNTASFSVTYPDGQSRDAFAVYPASIVAADAANYGQSGASLDVTLPGSYTIAEVSGTTTPCPMIAENTGSDWEFKQLCGMLRLTVRGITAEASYLKIDFNGKKVQGAFSIANTVTAGTSTIATSATTGTDDIISITGLTGAANIYDINLPLPTGEYTDVTVTVYNSSDAEIKTITRPLKASGTYTAARAKGRKLNAVLQSAFSVSSSKMVYFSLGNLQATTTDGSTWTWGFAAHQWDYIGGTDFNNGQKTGNMLINGDGTLSESDTYTVDLFSWVGASNTTWDGALGSAGNAAMHGITNSSALNSTDGYGNAVENLKSDWGNTISDSYTWRTLTKDEWAYVFDTRESGSTVNGTSNARYTHATINTDVKSGVNGMILFPDGITVDNSEATSWGNVNSASEWNTDTKCTKDEWTALAAKGCIFLPAAGERSPSTINRSGSVGFYWSFEGGQINSAYLVKFQQNNLYSRNLSGTRKVGLSVRLVRDM